MISFRVEISKTEDLKFPEIKLPLQTTRYKPKRLKSRINVGDPWVIFDPIIWSTRTRTVFLSLRMDERRVWLYYTWAASSYFGRFGVRDSGAGWLEDGVDYCDTSGRVRGQTAVSADLAFEARGQGWEEGQKKAKKAKMHKKRPKRVHLGFPRAVQVGQLIHC